MKKRWQRKVKNPLTEILVYHESEVTKEEITTEFSRYGTIKRIKFVNSRRDNQKYFTSRIAFDSEEDVKNVFYEGQKNLPYMKICLAPLKVKQARVKMSIFIRQQLDVINEYDLVKYFITSLPNFSCFRKYMYDRGQYRFQFDKALPYSFCHGHHKLDSNGVKDICFDLKLVPGSRASRDGMGGEDRGSFRTRVFFVKCFRNISVVYNQKFTGFIMDKIRNGIGGVKKIETMCFSETTRQSYVYFYSCESVRRFFDEFEMFGGKIERAAVKIRSLKTQEIQDVFSIENNPKFNEFEVIKFFDNYGYFNYKKVGDRIFFMFKSKLPVNFYKVECYLGQDSNRVKLKFRPETIKSFFEAQLESREDFKNATERIERSLEPVQHKKIEKASKLPSKGSILLTIGCLMFPIYLYSRLLSVLSLVVIVFIYALYNLLKARPKKLKEKGKITVMQYNVLMETSTSYLENYVYSRLDYSEKLSWNKRVEKIKKEVSDFSPDVVCFQEMEPEIEIDGYQLVTYMKGKVGILFKKDKFKMNKREIIDFNEKSLHGRIALIVTLQFGSDVFQVVNTHLYHTKKEQEKQGKMLLNGLSEMKNRVIFCGDFNCDPNDKVIRKMKKMFRSVYEDQENCYTFHSDERRHIDYVFYTDDLRVDKKLLLPPKKLRHFIPNSVHGSDHIPLFCEFTYFEQNKN